MRKGDDGGPLLAKSKESVTQIINYIVGIVGIPANLSNRSPGEKSTIGTGKHIRVSGDYRWNRLGYKNI